MRSAAAHADCFHHGSDTADAERKRFMDTGGHVRIIIVVVVVVVEIPMSIRHTHAASRLNGGIKVKRRTLDGVEMVL